MTSWYISVQWCVYVLCTVQQPHSIAVQGARLHHPDSESQRYIACSGVLCRVIAYVLLSVLLTAVLLHACRLASSEIAAAA